MFASFGISLVGMICIIVVPTKSQAWLTLFILGCKFGVSQTFCLVFIGNALIFPFEVVATTYGICGLCSNSFCILAPFVNEI